MYNSTFLLPYNIEHQKCKNRNYKKGAILACK